MFPSVAATSCFRNVKNVTALKLDVRARLSSVPILKKNVPAAPAPHRYSGDFTTTGKITYLSFFSFSMGAFGALSGSVGTSCAATDVAMHSAAIKHFND